MNENTATNQPVEKATNKPAMIAKQRVGRGKNATYERLGVAWLNDDGSIYIKVHGTQVITGGFVLYPIGENDQAEN
ncbi:hypothetical protein TH25_21155 [Thalassospira profundimaris]|uniref:Uncharacterized protein n=2 Tax=Thalassospira profundimaris TaxID=502049 RepID=A0A367WT90_9PROT|nr:hypothetical protein TH25_21155 [Thalassospira profundimaris]